MACPDEKKTTHFLINRYLRVLRMIYLCQVDTSPSHKAAQNTVFLLFNVIYVNSCAFGCPLRPFISV